MQKRQQIVGSSSISSLPRPGLQQQASSSLEQQQAPQNSTSFIPGDSSHGQPSRSASSQEAASSRGRSNAAATTAGVSHGNAAARQTRGGAKNYSTEEINALLKSICQILPTGNE